MKGERRYRYYVSRSLIKGTADSAGRGWRLPGPGIERTVAASTCQILSDRIGIAAAALGLAENRLPAIFAAAEGCRERLQSGFSAPHLAQRLPSGDPQSPQNRLLSGFSEPQLVQRIGIPGKSSDWPSCITRR
jgi:hypothetical protein